MCAHLRPNGSTHSDQGRETVALTEYFFTLHSSQSSVVCLQSVEGEYCCQSVSPRNICRVWSLVGERAIWNSDSWLEQVKFEKAVGSIKYDTLEDWYTYISITYGSPEASYREFHCRQKFVYRCSLDVEVAVRSMKVRSARRCDVDGRHLEGIWKASESYR